MGSSTSLRRDVSGVGALVLLVACACASFAARSASSEEMAPAQASPPLVADAATTGDPTSDPTDDWTDKERKILERGEYTTHEIVGGGLLGTLVGFGTGHVAQERWRERGWI